MHVLYNANNDEFDLAQNFLAKSINIESLQYSITLEILNSLMMFPKLTFYCENLRKCSLTVHVIDERRLQMVD